MIVFAKSSTLKSLSLSLNEFGELAIDAIDGNDEDASRSGLPLPNSSFLLAFDPLTREWTTIPVGEISDGYEITAIIKKVVPA